VIHHSLLCQLLPVCHFAAISPLHGNSNLVSTYSLINISISVTIGHAADEAQVKETAKASLAKKSMLRAKQSLAEVNDYEDEQDFGKDSTNLVLGSF
jgi:hypothetical protein